MTQRFGVYSDRAGPHSLIYEGEFGSEEHLAVLNQHAGETTWQVWVTDGAVLPCIDGPPVAMPPSMTWSRLEPNAAPPPALREVGLDATLELAHLLAIIDKAARRLAEHGDDVDARILQAHGAQLAAGREWPGMPIRSTVDFDPV